MRRWWMYCEARGEKVESTVCTRTVRVTNPSKQPANARIPRVRCLPNGKRPWRADPRTRGFLGSFTNRLTV